MNKSSKKDAPVRIGEGLTHISCFIENIIRKCLLIVEFHHNLVEGIDVHATRKRIRKDQLFLFFVCYNIHSVVNLTYTILQRNRMF